MCHQELHLVCQDTSIAQNKVFPQTGHIGRVKQSHISLLGGAAAFTMITGAAGGDHVHPIVDTVLGERDDVFSGEFFLVEMIAAIGAHIAVTGEKFTIGQARLHLERVDLGHAARTNDAVYMMMDCSPVMALCPPWNTATCAPDSQRTSRQA